MKTVSNVLTFKERMFIFLDMEEAPKWKQRLAVFGVFVFFALLVLFGSLLSGLLTGSPSGNNIPFV